MTNILLLHQPAFAFLLVSALACVACPTLLDCAVARIHELEGNTEKAIDCYLVA